MTILLTYHSGSTTPDESTTFSDLLPIGLCSLHAQLRSKGMHAHLANLSGMNEAQIAGLFKRLSPDIIGFSLWTHNRHQTLQLVRLAKKLCPQALVIAGGGHATHQAEALLTEHPELDLIVAGEGETTLLELIEAKNTQRAFNDIPGLVLRQDDTAFRTPARSRIGDLDRLPYASRYLHEAIGVDLELQPQFISTSRGCPSACRFCSSPRFWGRTVRTRSPASVVDEFLFLKKQFGMLYLSLRDDTFTADRRRTIELCRLLIAQKAGMFWNCQTRVEVVDDELLSWMKRAGCECVQLGVESGSPRILQQLGKRITPEQVISACDAVHKVGLQLSVYLIAGVPGETDQDRQATRKLLQRIRPHDLQVAPLAYYPGTSLYSDALRHQQVTNDLFEREQQDALLVLDDGNQRAARILRDGSGLAPTLSPRSIKELKTCLGYCAVTCLQAGDYYLQQGDWQHAEQEYREIIQHEPEHPWGWLLLAELYERIGQHQQASASYRKVLALVPHHGQSRRALAG